jgi:muramoyltetrapeptide carboxypeptidase
VFERHFEPMGIPVLFNLPLGHGKHLATIPLGVAATIDADARTLTIDEPALQPVEGGTE